VLIFGDPTFADEMAQGAARRFRQAAEVEGGLPRLAGSGAEARAVARHAGDAVVRLRGDASEAFLKHTPLERFDLLHFATHALVDEASLARTALALAPGQGEDGFVTPADLAALRLDAELVVLSACRTAGGVVVAGEGVQGLAAPLLQSGARSVVATQWQVPDRGTVRLVEDFYDALASGLPVAEALRAAKLAALRRGAPTGEWAAFTVLGDPLAEVALRRSGSRLPRWLPVGTVALLLGAGGYWVSRRRTPA
jgi:CHAT domain-containing protein